MGRTHRVSNSPYARPRVNCRKDSPTSKARERQTPNSSGVVKRDDLRSHQVPQNDATSSRDTQGLDHAALASSVEQQIVLELCDYISQSDSALGRSPGVMATPDTDTGTDQIANRHSNILDEHSNNVISYIELN